jgi:hypothetical protein
MMMTRRRAIYLFSALLCVSFAWLFVRLDEQASCHISNISGGDFWTSDFSSEIFVSTDKKTIDFTRLTQFENICVVALYTYGSPYYSKWMSENVKREGPKACWTDLDDQLTIAGIFKDGTPNWTRIHFEGAHRSYEFPAESCAAVKDATMRCTGNICRFATTK